MQDSTNTDEFPEYQSKFQTKIRFQKYCTLQQLYFQYFKTKIAEEFAKHHQKQFMTYIFIFTVKHDNQSWTQTFQYQDLCSFQETLSKMFKGIPPCPLKDDQKFVDKKILTSFIQFLDIFIKSIFQHALGDQEVLLFLNVFPQALGHGTIYGEFPMHKRSGGRYNQTSCIKQCYHCMMPCTRNWKLRYFTVTDNGILYTKKSKSYEIKDMLLYCFRFKIYHGLSNTGIDLGLMIESSTRKLKIQSRSLTNLVLMMVALHNALKDSPFSPDKRATYQKYGSFAPIRHNCSSKFYVDGKDYFSDMCDELKQAKKYVYITGWMITPYFIFKRPHTLNQKEYRLDGILEELAKRNVKIYIIVYQEPKIAINNDSEFVQEYLESRGSQNIKVVRHPNYLIIPFLWSHHEKIVLIDQKVAFFGGLDICYGRWDTPEHQLENPSKKHLWEGADLCNFRISDIYKPREYKVSNLDKTQPRMPWHDVAIQIRGSSVHDIARHFTNYWNFVNFQTKIDNDRKLLSLAGLKNSHPAPLSKFAAAKQFFKKFNFRRVTGKVEPVIDSSQPSEPTSPDSPELKYRESMLSARSSRHKDSVEEQFYQKYMQSEQEKLSLKDKLFKFPMKIFERLKDNDPEQDNLVIISNEEWKNTGTHQHLILRSSSTWSGGLQDLECSIHEAYLDLIRKSKHFIYIQNQFFIARQNQVIQALANRILSAYRNRQQFRVMVFIPLLPGFQGDVRESNSTIMKINLHLEYETIIRSKNSLYSRLKSGHMRQEVIQNYIKFFSLRQHALLQNFPVTQILYIHSKLMIVDDEKMILGSANINDRSLLGDRDSQIAILVQDDKILKKNEPQSILKQIRTFRVNLIREHFDISEAEAEHFHTQSNWKNLIYIAKRNTELYRYIFGCYPDDKMRKFKDIDKMESIPMTDKIQRYKEENKNIKGHVVELPLYFLDQENLELHMTQKQKIFLPDIFFS